MQHTVPDHLVPVNASRFRGSSRARCARIVRSVSYICSQIGRNGGRIVDLQVPLAVALLMACMLGGWLVVRNGYGGRGLIALLLVAVTAMQVIRLMAGF